MNNIEYSKESKADAVDFYKTNKTAIHEELTTSKIATY